MEYTKPTEPGRYLAIVKESKSWVYLSKDDKPSVVIGMVIDHGQGDNSGTEITWFGSLSTDKGRQITQDQLKRCFDWDWDSAALADGRVPFAGKEVEVVIEWNDWNGKKSLKAQWLNNPNAPESTVAQDPAKIRSILGALDRGMKANARGLAAKAVVPGRVVKATDPVELADDDIPF